MQNPRNAGRILCAAPTVVAAAWLAVTSYFQLPDTTTPPPVVCDSAQLREAARGHQRTIAAYWHGQVLLPTNGYGDSLECILVHEFAHHAQKITSAPLSDVEEEQEAYGLQRSCEIRKGGI
jgi:hypothetical protein